MRLIKRGRLSNEDSQNAAARPTSTNTKLSTDSTNKNIKGSHRSPYTQRTLAFLFVGFLLVALCIVAVFVVLGPPTNTYSGENSGVDTRNGRRKKKNKHKHHDSYDHDDSQYSTKVQDGLSREDSTGTQQQLQQSLLRTAAAAKRESQCTLWLAASSLKGHPGMGVFTTRHIERGEKVIPVNDGLTIPLYSFHYQEHYKEPNKAQKRAWVALWQEYVWSGNKPDHISYQEENNMDDEATMSSYAPCYSSLTNHHCMLASLRQRYPEPFYDDSLANRFQNASAGAFTYDIGRENTVGRNVEPGEELFLNYQYCQHGHRGNAPWAENAYMPEDFEMAKEIILDLIWKSLRIRDGRDGGLSWDAPIQLHVPNNTKKLVAELLPKTRAELEEMRASVDSVSNLRSYIAKEKGLNHYGDPEWVRANGMCLENFSPGKSTILPQAGRGGIANFLMHKGEMVAPAPLLQIMDKEALTMYKRGGAEKQVLQRWAEHGKQLLLNYCFGNPQSSLLLCPQTNVVMLNHCSTRTNECGSDGPNAEIRWAGEWHSSTKRWLDMSLEDMSNESTGGLAFEVVALRDIHPGEEVLIDYGIEWEVAWEAHLANWQQSKASVSMDSWITAKEANDLTGDILDELITGDLRKRADHHYLFTGCQYWIGNLDKHEMYQKKAQWNNLSDEEIMDLYADGYNAPKNEREYANHRDHLYWPCSIIKRTGDDSKTYTVRIHQSPFAREQPWSQHSVPRLLTNFPRQAIHYFVKPNMSDQQLDGAFRHPIGIPDSMFPKQWKNLSEE